MKKLILLAATLLSCLLKAQIVVPAAVLNVQPRTVCPGDSMWIDFSLQGTVPVMTPFRVVITLSNGGITIDDTVAFAGRLVDLFASGVLPNGDSTYHFKRYVPYGFPTGQTCIEAQFFVDESKHCVTVSRDCARDFTSCDSIPQINYSVGSHIYCATGTYQIGAPYTSMQVITAQYVDPGTAVWYVNGSTGFISPTYTFLAGAPGVTSFTLTGFSYLSPEINCYQSIVFSFTTELCPYGNYSPVGIEEYVREDINQPATYRNVLGQEVDYHPNELLFEYRGTRFRRKVLCEQR